MFPLCEKISVLCCHILTSIMQIFQILYIQDGLKFRMSHICIVLITFVKYKLVAWGRGLHYLGFCPHFFHSYKLLEASASPLHPIFFSPYILNSVTLSILSAMHMHRHHHVMGGSLVFNLQTNIFCLPMEGRNIRTEGNLFLYLGGSFLLFQGRHLFMKFAVIRAFFSLLFL